MTSEKTTPWYKEPMMLLVIGVPLAAVIWGFIMLSLALDTKDSLVSNSYYKDGMSYTQDQRFHEIIVNATSIADEEPGSLQLQLIHPTLEDRDLTLFLQRTPGGQYVAANELELPQKRVIWLTSPDQEWRVTARTVIENGKKIQTVTQ